MNQCLLNNRMLALLYALRPAKTRTSASCSKLSLPPGLVERSVLLLESLKVWIFNTSETCVALFQARLQSPAHSELDLAPGPDCARKTPFHAGIQPAAMHCASLRLGGFSFSISSEVYLSKLGCLCEMDTQQASALQ